MKKIFPLLCVMLLLSSCTGINSTVTDLMKPPKLTQKQEEIYSALQTAVGTDKITLKYPKSGNYRSAFVFRDIDQDGEEEALLGECARSDRRPLDLGL